MKLIQLPLINVAGRVSKTYSNGRSWVGISSVVINTFKLFDVTDRQISSLVGSRIRSVLIKTYDESDTLRIDIMGMCHEINPNTI